MENEKIYPACQTIDRTVVVGGLTKSQLFQKMQQHSIMMNELGKKLFADDRFTTTDKTYSLKTVELTVRDLGLPEGATTSQLFTRAMQLDLALCPLELGPYLRLEYRDQPEGYLEKPARKYQAPYGSITIASGTLTDDVEFPKGFYLRRINDVLWLRGYVADDKYVWGPDDHFVFIK
nr:helicase [Lentibacillus kapialis]